MLRSFEARGMFGCTSRTVSNARRVDIGIYLILTQGDGFNTFTLVSYRYVVITLLSVWYVWLCSVVRSCATHDDVNRDYACALTTSMETNRPPHLRPSRISPELRDYLVRNKPRKT